MRSIRFIPMVVGALLVASCAGGSDSGAAGEGVEQGRPPATTGARPASDDTQVDAPPATSYSDLRELVAAGTEAESTLALSEFAALYDVDLPGALPLVDDDSLPLLGTDAILRLAVLDAELDEEQRSIIDATLAAIDDASEEVYHSLDDPDYLVAVEESAGVGVEPEGLRRPNGFRSADAGPQTPPVPELLEVRTIAANAVITLQRRLGGVELDIFFRVGPLEVLGQTRFDEGRERCIVTIDEDRVGLTGDVLRSIVAHETFHCWHFLNRPSMSSFVNSASFFFEGVPTWVGEEYATGSNFGAGKWRNFVRPGTFRLGGSGYDAYGFWLQVTHLRGGSEAMWTLIPQLTAVADDPVALWDTAFRGLDSEAQASLASLTVRRPDWSPAWGFSIGQPADGRPIVERTVTPVRSGTHMIGTAEQSVVRFTFDGLSSDTSYVLTEEISGMATARFDGSGATDDVVIAGSTSQWCISGSCTCPDGVVPVAGLTGAPDGSTARTVALTTSFVSTSNVVSVELTDIDDLCADESDGPDVGAPGGGFEGLWRADPGAVELMFDEAFASGVPSDQRLDVAGVAGDLLMEFRPDGTGRLTYAGITLFINEAAVGDLTLDGFGTFVWGVVGDTVRISGNEYSITVSSGAFGVLDTFTQSDVDVGGGTTELTAAIAGDMLTVDAAGSSGLVFFPVSWQRVS